MYVDQCGVQAATSDQVSHTVHAYLSTLPHETTASANVVYKAAEASRGALSVYNTAEWLKKQLGVKSSLPRRLLAARLAKSNRAQLYNVGLVLPT